MGTFPKPNPRPLGWAPFETLAASAVTQINANAASAADGDRWSDYSHLRNIKPTPTREPYSDGVLAASTFADICNLHYVPGAEVWLVLQHFGAATAEFALFRDSHTIRYLDTPPVATRPILAASKESTGEVAVIMNAANATSPFQIVSFTLEPAVGNQVTGPANPGEAEAGYATLDTETEPGTMTGYFPYDMLWIPSRSWWITMYTGSGLFARTSPDLATWTTRTFPSNDGTHGNGKFAFDGDSTLLYVPKVNPGSGSLRSRVWRSGDGGENWTMVETGFILGPNHCCGTWVPDHGVFMINTGHDQGSNPLTLISEDGLTWETAGGGAPSLNALTAHGRLAIGVFQPDATEAECQLVASTDAGESWFNLRALERQEMHFVRYNGRQLMLYTGEDGSAGLPGFRADAVQFWISQSA